MWNSLVRPKKEGHQTRSIDACVVDATAVEPFWAELHDSTWAPRIAGVAVRFDVLASRDTTIGNALGRAKSKGRRPFN